MTLSKFLSRATQLGVTLAVTFASLGIIYPEQYGKYKAYSLNFLSVYEIFLWFFGTLIIIFAVFVAWGANLSEDKIKVIYNKENKDDKEDTIDKFKQSFVKVEESTSGLWNKFFHFLTIPEALLIIIVIGDASLALIFVSSQIAISSLKPSLKKLTDKLNSALTANIKPQ